MARLSIHTDRVRSFVDQSLVPLFLAEQNTARLCKSLNQSLADTVEKGVIHPNRIHALLSDDVSRGVNEGSFELIERAASALQSSDSGWKARSEKQFASLNAEADSLRNRGGLDNQALEKRLGLPPAIARHVLENGAAGPSSRTEQAILVPTREKRDTPDWSFQEIAISQTLEALRQRPASKIGLILPTGAGKTRTALRIVLQQLATIPDSDARVYWVIHRKNLRMQAHRELQKLLSTGKDQIPDNATALINRIEFVMVGALPEILASDAIPPALVVVDEAHHAAAPSYQSIFDTSYPLSALFLTATPNRTDLLPIGIDEISFTITYRELEDRGVIVMPEFLDFPVDDFEWSEDQVRDLANFVIEESGGSFTKILVLAPRIDRVKEFYEALVTALQFDLDHPLDEADIGYIHGTGNSLYMDNDDFLDLFAKKPRAIIVSAQILLEGFDDPAINAVVLTYPSQSVVRLMQAAGRCVRYSPGKNAAYVVQPRNDALAYHFDQRWLYQEISDYLRPELLDIDYATEADLEKKVADLFERHNIKPNVRDRIGERLSKLSLGETCCLLFYGYPYYGETNRFDKLAKWGAFLETPNNSGAFRSVFNAFSALGAHLSDPTEFLTREGARFGIKSDTSPSSMWMDMMEVLTSSFFAREEIYGSNAIATASRPIKGRQGPTTWLRYVTLNFRPQVASELTEFLADCYNREKVITDYLDNSDGFALVVKIPLPLADYEAWLLTPEEARVLDSCVAMLRKKLINTEPADQFGTLASYLARADHRGLPTPVFLRVEALLNTDRYDTRVLRLSHAQSLQDIGDE